MPRAIGIDPMAEKAKTEWLRGGFLSLSDIARKYGVTKGRVWRWFRRGHWEEAAREYIEKQRAIPDELAQQYVDLGRVIVSNVGRHLKSYIDRNEIVPIKDLKELATILGNVQHVQRVALGQSGKKYSHKVAVHIDLAKMIESRARENPFEGIIIESEPGRVSDPDDPCADPGEGPSGYIEASPAMQPDPGTDPLLLAVKTASGNGGNGSASS